MLGTGWREVCSLDGWSCFAVVKGMLTLGLQRLGNDWKGGFASTHAVMFPGLSIGLLGKMASMVLHVVVTRDYCDAEWKRAIQLRLQHCSRLLLRI